MIAYFLLRFSRLSPVSSTLGETVAWVKFIVPQLIASSQKGVSRIDYNADSINLHEKNFISSASFTRFMRYAV
jgi:hypothetical protein